MYSDTDQGLSRAAFASIPSAMVIDLPGLLRPGIVAEVDYVRDKELLLG
jgi:hypothetical protein